MSTARPTAFAALAVALVPGASELQILPAGTFRARDGRPAEVPAWKLDAEQAARVIATAARQQTRIVIDYEHQTLRAEKNGQPAPAAGWIDPQKLEWRDGQGLFARDVEWTAAAAAHIAAGEYRYFSPVFEYDKRTGAVLALRLGALTNNPGLDGMAAVALSALSTHLIDEEIPAVNETLKKLLAALGLPEATSEETALTAVAALKARADVVEEVRSALDVPAQGSISAALTALKAKAAGAPDPAQFAPVAALTALQGQVASLSAQLVERDLDQVIADAREANKITPALEAWARELGKKDLAALKRYIETAPAIAPVAGQSGGKAPAGGGAGADSADAIAAAALKYQAEQAAAGVTVTAAAAVAHVTQKGA